MRVMFSGGGTAGSVTPLLAIAERMNAHELIFVGTYHGVERKLVPVTMKYIPLLAGKLRRYWSLRNLLDLIVIKLAFFQAWWILLREQPDVVVSAGGYVATPLAWAAWWCNIPVVLHQSDMVVSLSTKLVKPFAAVVTKAFAETKLQAEHIGNPVRSLTVATQDFLFQGHQPTVLIMGGGTGALAINELVSEALCTEANVIHVTGEGKSAAAFEHPNYYPVALLQDNFAEAIHQASVVVTRAGMGTLSELAELGKACIIIPIPQSHQERNAQALAKTEAAIVLDQTTLTTERLAVAVHNVLNDPELKSSLEQNIRKVLPANAAQTLCQRILQL